MKCICASSVSLGREAFSPLGDLVWIPETDITPAVVRDADAVITRSKTRLNRALFEGSRVRFAGTCTAGTDHADPAALADLGIHFASAPGCNANAVSEYLTAALLEARATTGFPLEGRTLGIIGHGQVGTRVERKAKALGMRVPKNDPPKQAAGSDETFTPLDELLEASDAVTLHVPLVEDGPWPTRGLLGEKELARMKSGAVLINACRGEALANAPLIRARKEGHLSFLVLDVWDPEPGIPEDLLNVADLATAHIAGHSVEGKVNGTRQIREALCAALAPDASPWNPRPLLPEPEHPVVSLAGFASPEERLRAAVRACYDIRRDDAALRESHSDRATLFTSLRRTYRDRREFDATTLTHCPPDERDRFQALGFHLTQP